MARILFGSALGLVTLVLAVVALAGFVGACTRPKLGKVLDGGESFLLGLLFTFFALIAAAATAQVFGW